MNSQAQQYTNILQRVLPWLELTAVVLILVSVSVQVFFPQSILGHAYPVAVGLQYALIVLTISKRRGIIQTLPLLFGVILLTTFLIYARLWLLLMGGIMSVVGVISVAWPRLREIYHRLSTSYREISASSKE